MEFRKYNDSILVLVETGLYFGKGNGIDDKGGEMHGSVPVAVKGGGITVTRIPISHVPNCGGNESDDNARRLAQLPSQRSHSGKGPKNRCSSKVRLRHKFGIYFEIINVYMHHWLQRVRIAFPGSAMSSGPESPR